MLAYIGRRLLEMPNIRRIRYATKGLCVLPQKILTDDAWLDAYAGAAPRDVFDDIGFEVSEGCFAEACEVVADGAARTKLDFVVAIDNGQAQMPAHMSTHRGLATARHSDQRDA